MLFADRGPLVIVSHMVKAGTDSSPAKPAPNLTGVWNLTHNRSNGVTTTGLITIKEQKNRIWSGTEQIRDENGTMIEEPVVGTIGDTGRLYATSQDGAFMLGSLNRNETIDSAFLIPGDTDGTFVVNRWMTRDEMAEPESDLSYPDIAGDWKIDDRKVIQDGNITDEGPVSSEWMSFSNQTGRFFTAMQHTLDTVVSQNMESSAIFRTPDEAYLTNADSAFIQYHILNNSSIEAIVNLKDGKSLLYMDMLTRKQN